MRRIFLALALMCMAFTTNAQSLLFGDITNNCVVDVNDVTKLIDIVLKGGHTPLTRTMEMEVGNKVIFGFTSGGNTYSISSSTPSVAEASITGSKICIKSKSLGKSTITVTDSESNTLATIEVAVIEGAEAVDLGLPSGLLWSDKNMGASSPEEYGYYFAWGETTPKSNEPYNWTTYKWCEGSDTTMTKYCNVSYYGKNGFTDDKTVLEEEDDAAHVNWGDSWRMPTKAEFDELTNSNYTIREWVTQNGVCGYKFTSKSNGNSIFLPAAGNRTGNDLDDAGSYGYYWSSTLYEIPKLNQRDPSCAWYLTFNNDEENSNHLGTNGNSRYYGRSVRPVRKK